MKKIKSILTVAACFLFVNNFSFCFEPVSTSELLLSYLENDQDLKKAAMEIEKTQLSLNLTEINNGFDVEISTGTISIKSDESGAVFSIRPSVQASLPQASNLKLSASTSYNYKSATSTIDDTKLNASVDIISEAGTARDITLLKAERSLEEAKRKLKNQAINAEKNFYTELKSLLNSTSSIISAQKTLYNNKIDFDKIKAQGYTSSSSTYRLAQSKVQSQEHEIESSSRALVRSYVVFYKKCGYDITLDSTTDFYSLIPSDIPQVEAVDFNDFDPDTYTEIESALWNNKINSMQRDNQKSFTLSANGGVTFNNSMTSTTTIDAGLSSKIGGVDLSALISFPIASGTSPALTLSASLSPNTFRKNTITKQQNELAEKEEEMTIENARWNYELKKAEWAQNLEDILWNTKSDEESYKTNASLEKDLGKYYRQGLISQSEYLSAKVNLQSSTVKKIINSIDLIIYNDNILTQFTGDKND